MATMPLSKKQPRSKLVGMLSKSLGEEKANEVIILAATELKISKEVFDQEEALKVLDKISQTPGLVGIVSRLAKVHVRLDWNTD